MYHLVSVDVEDLGAALVTMQILFILWVDVDDPSAVQTTTMWLILLLILAKEDSSLVLSGRCG